MLPLPRAECLLDVGLISTEILRWTNQDCNIRACDLQGNNALHLALSGSAPASVIAELMRNKADALKANTKKKTPFELAVASDAVSGYVQIIIPLIPEAQLNKPLACGSTPCEYALVRTSSCITLYSPWIYSYLHL
jgi:hypothetical protein